MQSSRRRVSIANFILKCFKTSCVNRSSSLICNINQVDIVPGFKTDQLMITLKTALLHNQRGRGFWKLSMSPLTEDEYQSQIKTVIQETKKKCKSDNSITLSLLGEIIKMKVREQSIFYGAAKKSKYISRKNTLHKEIADLEGEIIFQHGHKRSAKAKM